MKELQDLRNVTIHHVQPGQVLMHPGAEHDEEGEDESLDTAVQEIKITP